MKRIRFEDAIVAGSWVPVAALGAAAGAGRVSLQALDAVPLCLFRALWGVPCPGCGMGRALMEFFSGDWIASFAQHPLGPLVAVAWTAWTARIALRSVRGAAS